MPGSPGALGAEVVTEGNAETEVAGEVEVPGEKAAEADFGRDVDRRIAYAETGERGDAYDKWLLSHITHQH